MEYNRKFVYRLWHFVSKVAAAQRRPVIDARNSYAGSGTAPITQFVFYCISFKLCILLDSNAVHPIEGHT